MKETRKLQQTRYNMQLNIPKEMTDKLDLKKGSLVDVEFKDGKIIITKGEK